MDIASNWKVLSGIEGNWEGLFDPNNIDDKLRYYLVHYGERTRAAGDCFNVETKLPRFQPQLIFSKTGLQNNNLFKYLVTDYLYATSEFWLQPGTVKTEFAGYVAVASDEGKVVLGRRDILICWRGTDPDWKSPEAGEDTELVQVKASELFPNTEAQVHHGFFDFYTKKSESLADKTSARDQVVDAVRRLVDKYAALNEEVSITVTGFSLGAAIATLNSMDIVYNGYNNPTGSSSAFPVTAFAYASPQVGDENFKKLFDELNLNKDLHLLRIRNAKDIVPDLVKDFAKLIGVIYDDVGVELDIDTDNSPVTKSQNGLHHEPNLYLYGIAAYPFVQGQGIAFDFTNLNRYVDLLKDEYNVPPQWWDTMNDSNPTLMVQLDSGIWMPTDTNNGTK